MLFPHWGSCFPQDRMGRRRRTAKVCWVVERKKMQLSLILPSASSRRGVVGAGLSFTEDGQCEYPRDLPALGFAWDFSLLGSAPGQPHHCVLKNILAGVKSNSFILMELGSDASKCWQTPVQWVSHHRAGQGKVMPGTNPSGCSPSPVQAGAALSPGCAADTKITF